MNDTNLQKEESNFFKMHMIPETSHSTILETNKAYKLNTSNRKIQQTKNN